MNTKTKNVLTDLKTFGIVLAVAILIAWTGSTGSVLLPFVTTSLCAAGGWFASKRKGGKGNWKAAVGWGALGLAAGLGWYFFGI